MRGANPSSAVTDAVKSRISNRVNALDTVAGFSPRTCVDFQERDQITTTPRLAEHGAPFRQLPNFLLLQKRAELLGREPTHHSQSGRDARCSGTGTFHLAPYARPITCLALPLPRNTPA